ncbi:carbohydrate ABC transporter substrate-binding protein, CUT1 family [Streptomyces zhaozhouensis]|uniref:Carbohydrate ABC transporter substrate-binding protein, CUT1 family n=1 Tax=Streptomyces zhaozhouensis TaxID=1300267 RepID=A0A286DSP2_9ACTN|nr:extracellular solute-binding protein [Streptomyces zhaozhouensis]SOD61692.1 carbohydrate ABC transporter substrate-binding protein, CUT1 family [Streptomyces zhaozhouensis]
MRVLTRRLVALTGALALSGTVAACGSDGDGDSGTIELTISMNAIAGGKNAAEADWVEQWVIPRFEEEQAAAGVEVDVTFEPSGVDDEQYKSRLALDLQSGAGPDLYTLDGIWLGEFAQAGYVEPLERTDPDHAAWEGWEQIPDAVQALATFDGALHGIPAGTDGRVLYYNRQLFAEAGLPADWQPADWDEIIGAAEALAALDGVTPIQLNAGTAMGEATTMQGVLPLLAGAGEEIHTEGAGWTGDSAGLERVLDLYAEIYGAGLGDRQLQQETQGRDKSFEEFAAGEIGILLESDYFWRSVVNPDGGVAPMQDRDEDVGYALIPAVAPGAGLDGADHVSTSGGNVRVVNPAGDHADLAWELLTFMHSAEAVTALVGDDPRITARADVNEALLGDDPMLTFVNEQVLPLTSYRPALDVYPQVSVLLQEATAAVVDGGDPAEAAADYREGLEEVVDGDIAP